MRESSKSDHVFTDPRTTQHVGRYLQRRTRNAASPNRLRPFVLSPKVSRVRHGEAFLAVCDAPLFRSAQTTGTRRAYAHDFELRDDPRRTGANTPDDGYRARAFRSGGHPDINPKTSLMSWIGYLLRLRRGARSLAMLVAAGCCCQSGRVFCGLWAHAGVHAPHFGEM